MVIANSCAGAFTYCNKEENRNYKYDNPFVGCTIFEDSYYRLLRDFDKIDFMNYNLDTKNFPLQPDLKKNCIKLYDTNNEEIIIFFIHYDELDVVEQHWKDRVIRLIEKLKNPNWKDDTLFIYSPYFAKKQIKLKYPEYTVYHSMILNSFDDLKILTDYIEGENNKCSENIDFIRLNITTIQKYLIMYIKIIPSIVILHK